MLKIMLACGWIIGMASCGNTNGGRDNTEGADSLFGDSVARDSATWDVDTTKTTDSLASPSFP